MSTNISVLLVFASFVMACVVWALVAAFDGKPDLQAGQGKARAVVRAALLFLARAGALVVLACGAYRLGVWLGAGEFDLVDRDVAHSALVVIERGRAS